MHVILASKSPRRLHLLQAAGLSVEVRPVHIDETLFPDEDVALAVQRLAQTKARALAVGDHPVIAADTLVALDGKALGQPRDKKHAYQMLQALADSRHHVFTGVCVGANGVFLHKYARTEVCFCKFSHAQITAYLEHNEVMDKAGAYEIQGGAASFVRFVDGPLDNVIGLPVHITLSLLNEVTTNEH
ncbi:MAG: Maf family protein [Mariprofundaceae bacterium]|nr:Maf family protein [Mariprofundaceae bacterium]